MKAVQLLNVPSFLCHSEKSQWPWGISDLFN